MKFGITMFPTDYAIHPTEFGRAVEDLGFESLWFPEHTHIPASRKTPWPGGADLPREYFRTHDPFVALGAVAAVTTSLRLCTGVCLVIERDPITLAKEVASLDALSGGRFEFGIGGGWNLEEMENHGTRPATRWRVLRERILAMKEIWTSDEAEFHGKFVDFGPIFSWPKPVQQPHPPIWVGGQGPRTLDRVVEFGDGWIPNRVRLADMGAKISELQTAAKAGGRDYIPVAVFGARPDEATIERYAEAGVSRCVFYLPAAEAAETLPLLKQRAELMRAAA
ncbi:MAG TPA: LLM class F420-dependent oxidoreductase [Dehalococcoidia bacterium]|nr:LLM class F420-dependent oxidoreductase [Dehalococcoidia bacterium]